MNRTSERLNEHREGLQADMSKDPRRLEREAERARAEVEHTLDILEQRLSPGELLDQGLRMLRGGDGTFGANLAAQVRNNPLPTVLTGVGLAWLIAESRRPPASHEGDGRVSQAAHQAAASARTAVGGVYESAHYAKESASGAASGLADSARDMAGSARGAAGSMADSARGAADSARGAMARGGAGARSAMHGASRASSAAADNVRHSYEYLSREQPLLLGAIGIAAGALLGAMLPQTRTEDETLGEYSDEAQTRLKDQARSAGAEAKEAAASAAESAVGAAESSQRSSGTSPSGSTNPTGPANPATNR